MDQDPFRTLFIAIHTSNIEQMKEAIRSGVNINQKNSVLNNNNFLQILISFKIQREE